ncbi:MAG TPA: OmpH family outer membrane protein [Puia sp.]|jgi:outer membrane protein|nr:OmpH family outer membrane protein [Puia sp.]
MKNFSAILSVICLVLVGVLFYLFYNHTEQIKKISVATEKQTASNFRIAYFEMDSLEAHYNYFKDAEGQAKAKEAAMNSELSSMEKGYQKKIAEWQQKSTSMTQAESQQAQQEYASMQQNYNTRKQSLQEELAKHNGEIMTDIKKRIETFLKDYNKHRSFSFIFAYDPTSIIYYKDSSYNITSDVITGLNQAYKKKD